MNHLNPRPLLLKEKGCRGRGDFLTVKSVQSMIPKVNNSITRTVMQKAKKAGSVVETALIRNLDNFTGCLVSFLPMG